MAPRRKREAARSSPRAEPTEPTEPKPEPRAAADAEASAAGGGRRRGLGQLGLRAFQQAIPELTLLPRRDSFDAGDIEDLSGLRPAQLRKLTRALPELLRADKGRYSRQQVEQILRAKRLLAEGLAPEELRERLLALASAPARSPAREPRAPLPSPPAARALPAAAVHAVHALPAAPGGAALPPALLQQVRAELQAIIALCSEEDEPT